ncbi:MAG: hypothetical protein U5L00_07370 [Desulfovermiculus sp.]|nr:hypothetical protein [Desulfovermiculus sp.]
MTSIKTLILEYVTCQGTGHVKEIHLRIAEFRPEVPQHTVRARLSELSRTRNLEERLEAFGNGFYGLYQENELCSVVSYPDRGPWGDPRYRGNCSGHLVKDLILRFQCNSVFDPAEGSGTVKDVVTGINTHLDKAVEYQGRDLREGWDILESRLPEEQFDLVWYHPPYWDIIKYSDRAKDLSNCETLQEFEEKLCRSVKRLMQVVRPGGILAVLIGDKRKNGRYFALVRSLLNSEVGLLKAIIVKVQHNCTSDRRSYAGSPFLIPIKHEYCLVYQKPS